MCLCVCGFICECLCVSVYEWWYGVCLVCVIGLYLIIIKHRDTGDGTELWCDEVKQEQ